MTTCRASERCVEKLLELEGFRDKPYRDGGGLWTIGYGRLCSKDAPPTTKAAEMEFVYNRLNSICSWLDARLPWLQTYQVDAMCLFFFNTGTAGFMSTQTGQLLNARDPEFLTWFKRWTHDAKGNVEQGLVNRRRFEAQLFLFGWG